MALHISAALRKSLKKYQPWVMASSHNVSNLKFELVCMWVLIWFVLMTIEYPSATCNVTFRCLCNYTDIWQHGDRKETGSSCSDSLPQLPGHSTASILVALIQIHSVPEAINRFILKCNKCKLIGCWFQIKL